MWLIIIFVPGSRADAVDWYFYSSEFETSSVIPTDFCTVLHVKLYMVININISIQELTNFFLPEFNGIMLPAVNARRKQDKNL